MQNQKITTQQIVLYALGMAIVFVATLYMKIPNGLDGYFNLGDGFILLFASLLGPFGGFLIGGLGSALADVAGGYAYYFFFTLIIKGCEGLLVGWLIRKYGSRIRFIAYTLGSVIMVSGYFLAKWYLKGSMLIALSGVAENIVQSAVGVVICLIALPMVSKHFASSNVFSKIVEGKESL